MNKWLQLLEMIGPTIMAVAGVPPLMIKPVMTGINIAEQIHDQGGLGPEKTVFVTNMAATVLSGIAAAKPGLIDAPTATAAIQLAIPQVIAAVNALHTKVAIVPEGVILPVAVIDPTK